MWRQLIILVHGLMHFLFLEEGNIEADLILHIFRNRGLHRAAEGSPDVEEGDAADHAGRRHVGHGVKNPRVKVNLTEFNGVPLEGDIPGLRPHPYRHADPANSQELKVREIHYIGEDLDLQLDNFTRGAEIAWYERTRLFWGTQVLYRIIYVLYYLAKNILSCLGIHLFRSSRPIEPGAPLHA